MTSLQIKHIHATSRSSSLKYLFNRYLADSTVPRNIEKILKADAKENEEEDAIKFID